MPGETKVNQAAIDWQNALAEAVKEWCDTHRYHPRNKLAKELDIKNERWSRIAAGSGITDPETYAKIYVRTGLSQADPRTIPPMFKLIPGTGQYMDVARAWTDAQYQRWLRTDGEKYLPPGQRPPEVATQPASPVATPMGTPTFQLPQLQTVGAVIDLVLGSFAAQMATQFQAQARSDSTGVNPQDIADQIAVRLGSTFAQQTLQLISGQLSELLTRVDLKGEIQTLLRDELSRFRDELPVNPDIATTLNLSDDQVEAAITRALRKILPPTQTIEPPKPHTNTREDVGSLARRLYQSLQLSLKGTVEDRNQLVREHGQDIGRLLPIIDALTEPEEKRERSLQRVMEVSL